MLKQALIALGITVAALAPTAAFAFDPPTPPWQSTPECDAGARRYAYMHDHVIGSPTYNWYYYEYYYQEGNCPIQD